MLCRLQNVNLVRTCVAVTPASVFTLLRCYFNARVFQFPSLSGANECNDSCNAVHSQESLTLKGHTRFVVSVAFSLDGTRLASASFDKRLKVWEVSDGSNR